MHRQANFGLCANQSLGALRISFWEILTGIKQKSTREGRSISRQKPRETGLVGSRSKLQKIIYCIPTSGSDQSKTPGWNQINTSLRLWLNSCLLCRIDLSKTSIRCHLSRINFPEKVARRTGKEEGARDGTLHYHSSSYFASDQTDVAALGSEFCFKHKNRPLLHPLPRTWSQVHSTFKRYSVPDVVWGPFLLLLIVDPDRVTKLREE